MSLWTLIVASTAVIAAVAVNYFIAVFIQSRTLPPGWYAWDVVIVLVVMALTEKESNLLVFFSGLTVVTIVVLMLSLPARESRSDSIIWIPQAVRDMIWGLLCDTIVAIVATRVVRRLRNQQTP